MAGGRRGRGGIPSIADLLPSRLGALLGRPSQFEAAEDELGSNRSDDEAMGGPRRVVIRRFFGGVDRDRDRERDMIQLEALARSGREVQERERQPLEENEIERTLEEELESTRPPEPPKVPKPAEVKAPEPVVQDNDPVLLPVVD